MHSLVRFYKVDRSAAACYIAKNMAAAGVMRDASAAGICHCVAEPVSATYHSWSLREGASGCRDSRADQRLIDLRPCWPSNATRVQPTYLETAATSHGVIVVKKVLSAVTMKRSSLR